MKKLLALLLIVFSCQFTFAADDGDFWLQRQIIEGDGKNAYGKKIYGKAARAVMEDIPLANGTGSSVQQMIKRSIAADKPTPTKVGSSMLKRIYSPQAIVGTAAVTGLLAAIGWVMEDGVYVKKIPQDSEEPDNSKYAYSANNRPSDPRFICYGPSSCKTAMNAYTPGLPNLKCSSDTASPPNIHCAYKFSGSPEGEYVLSPFLNPKYEKPPEDKIVPLTAALLGAAMLGSQYTDPDPKFDNDTVNTGDYTGVKDIYEHDPSGVGDELADAMDDKLKNAKPTDDGKSSYIGDPKYDDRPLGDDRDDSSDRGWDEKGDEATGGTEPEKDPETGEATGNQSITIKFPLFCSWASKMCLWYDDWKASDKVYKDHMKKTEEHQTSEKSFWETVKDWFDWTKEEPEPEENQQPEPDDQGIFTRTFDTTFTLSKQCPPDVPINFESTYLTGSFTFSMNWLCIIFTFMAYPLVFLSHCLGMWILYEAVIQKQIKW
jgi:hypothetical protein